MKHHKFSKNSKKNMERVRPSLIELAERVLKKSPHDFGIPKYGGKRSPQEQNKLYHQRPKVTNLDGFIKKSYHQTGNALDFFVYDEHGACWQCAFKYSEIAQIFKSEFDLMKAEGKFEKNEVLKWGGDWKYFKDLPHIEIREI